MNGLKLMKMEREAKKQLANTINYVKQSFYMYPLESNESMEQAFGFCVRCCSLAAEEEEVI